MRKDCDVTGTSGGPARRSGRRRRRRRWQCTTRPSALCRPTSGCPSTTTTSPAPPTSSASPRRGPPFFLPSPSPPLPGPSWRVSDQHAKKQLFCRGSLLLRPSPPPYKLKPQGCKQHPVLHLPPLTVYHGAANSAPPLFDPNLGHAYVAEGLLGFRYNRKPMPGIP